MNSKADENPSRKRARSPSYPPIVLDYRPYTGRQLTSSTTSSHKRQWDLYYRNNTVNGYKDRHYMLREFKELNDAIMAALQREQSHASAHDPSAEYECVSWMEAGCGVGNAMLPVFEEYGALAGWSRLVGFDISSVAIQLLQRKRDALAPKLREKLHVCVLDPTESDVADCPFFERQLQSSAAARSPVVSNPVRFVSMVFVLCSIPVACHGLVLARIAACMARPGGVFFFRDYAADDQAQKRFRERDVTRCGGSGGGGVSSVSGTDPVSARAENESKPIANDDDEAQSEKATSGDQNTYTRTNGTLSHFFTLDEARRLFETAGFAVIDLRMVEVEVTNRKKGVSFDRKFIQGRFRLANS